MKTLVDCWLEATNPTLEEREEAQKILQKMIELYKADEPVSDKKE